jgi:tetratricopeptide (TPR) repeat protein
MRRLIAVLLLSSALVTAGSVAGGRADDASSVSARLERAQRLFRTAELTTDSPLREATYKEAEQLAEQIVSSDSDNAQAHFLLFASRCRRLVAERGEPSLANFWVYAAAHDHLTRALELDPYLPGALAARGGILVDLPPILGGDRAAGRDLLQRAITLNPTGSGTRVTLARALLRDGERDAARHQLLLAAHYACLKHQPAILEQAEALLSQLQTGRL